MVSHTCLEITMTTQEPAASPPTPLRRSRRALQHLNKRISPQSSEGEPVNKRAKSSQGRKTPREESLPGSVKEVVALEVKEEPEKDEENHPGTELSAIEQRMQQRIAERQRMLESLGILMAKEDLTKAVVAKSERKPIYRGIMREKKSPEPVIRRRSLRQQNMTPDGLHLTLPSEMAVSRAGARSVPDERDYTRPPPGPGPLMDYYTTKNREECDVMLGELSSLCGAPPGTASVWGASVDSVIKTMKKMKVSEETVVKVVPDRICSVQLHPSLDKTLVLVGGKWGQLGVWEVGRDDETSGAYFFCPHSRPINCLTVSPTHPQHTYTTSYDGSVRRVDLVAGLLQEVYSIQEDSYTEFLTWHSHQDPDNLLVAASQGRVFHVDIRMARELAGRYLVHAGKTVKVVTVHPTHTHYFATGCNDGTISLWDARKHKNNKPLSTCVHNRLVSGLEFSPVTGDLLVSTSMDNRIRFISCDRTSLAVERQILHDNHTGRWLTTFKARFIPGREDLICVGSMLQPRRVEVWGRNGELKHKFFGESLGSVSSVVALHPTRPVLAGCNSSGKVHVFM